MNQGKSSMRSTRKQWRLASSLPLVTLVLSLAVGSWGVFAALMELVHGHFGLAGPALSMVLTTPLAAGLILLWPLYRWALASSHPGGVLLLVFLGLTPALAGLTLASDPGHLLLVGLGLGLVPGCFAAGVVHLNRLTGIPCLVLSPALIILCFLGAVFAYASTPLISEAFGWRATPLMSIALIVIAAVLLAVLGEPPEPRR